MKVIKMKVILIVHHINNINRTPDPKGLKSIEIPVEF